MKLRLLMVLSVVCSLCLTGYGQVFQQDFDGVTNTGTGGMPADFTLYNVDGLTVNSAQQVNYITQAWVRHEDLGTAGDSAAFSTSWYASPGQSNDWMFTPAISVPANAVLTWNAIAYDDNYRDGYEVRIATALPSGNPSSATGTVVFSTSAENSSWTSHTVSLASYSGQTIYVAFRNNSTDKFILAIDDITVEQLAANDVSIDSSAAMQYTLVPVSQAVFPIGGRIKNVGSAASTNVALNVSVYNSANQVVHSGTSSTVASLASGASVNASIANFTATQPDLYMIVYNVTLTETDGNVTNNVDTQYVEVTGAVYARDNGDVTGSLGIGAGNGGYLGQDFDIVASASLNSVGSFLNRGYTGRKYALLVWSMVADTPATIIASTDTIVFADDSARYYNLPIHGGPITLTPGRYAFTAVEFDSTLALAQTSEIFTAGRTWVKWPTTPFGGWAHNETFGASFSKSYVIRPVLCPSGTPVYNSAAPICTSSNGTIELTSAPGDGPYSVNWSTGGTGPSISNLAAGNYTVTVTDVNGCVSNATITLTADNTPLSAVTTFTPATCTASNGSASVTASTGTLPLTYAWTGGGNTATINNLAAGTYIVTVSDANGCSGTASSVVTVDQVTITGTTTTTPSSCTSNTGSATVSVINGNGPYTYAWTGGGTGTTISNAGAGVYNVTISDANGCSGTLSATITTPNGPSATAATVNVSCNGGNNGSVDVTVTGGTGTITYNWSNSASTQDLSGLSAGSYVVTVQDANNCSFVVTNTITQPNAISATATTTADSGSTNGTVSLTVTGGTSPYTFSWSNNATTEDLANIAAGTYTVTVTDANNCTSTASFTVSSAVGINEISVVSGFKVFPNPTTGILNINYQLAQSTAVKLEVLDIKGQVLYSEKIGATNLYTGTVNLSTFNSGIYIVRLTGQQVTAVQRVTLVK